MISSDICHRQTDKQLYYQIFTAIQIQTQVEYSITMASFYDVNAACNNIHNLVQSSGLHFVINQTPWSSFINLRREFVRPALAAQPTLPGLGVNEQEKKLEQQIIALEYELIDAQEKSRVAEKRAKQIVENMHSKIDDLENSLETTKFELKKKEKEIAAVEKEKKVKDEIIQNLNDGFNKKILDFKVKVKGLEDFKKEVIKKDKKARKKLRQKTNKDQERRGSELRGNHVITNNNATVEGNCDQEFYSCDLCGKLVQSVNKLEEHARTEHEEELSKVARMFEDQNVESRELLKNVPESEYILTPEEITHFGVDWEIHLKVCQILKLEKTNEHLTEE